MASMKDATAVKTLRKAAVKPEEALDGVDGMLMFAQGAGIVSMAIKTRWPAWLGVAFCLYALGNRSSQAFSWPSFFGALVLNISMLSLNLAGALPGAGA